MNTRALFYVKTQKNGCVVFLLKTRTHDLLDSSQRELTVNMIITSRYDTKYRNLGGARFARVCSHF